jgi:hypothetical protein
MEHGEYGRPPRQNLKISEEPVQLNYSVPDRV